MKARRRHVFAYGARGVVACKRCGVERRTALVGSPGVTAFGRWVNLYRDAKRSDAWTTASPGCAS